jgi:hypothetical protein
MGHLSKHTYNIRREKTQIKHWKQKLATYVYNYCNTCNIQIYFCNICMKHLQHTSKTSETLETYSCNMRFQRNISLLFRNGSSLARGVDTLVEKAVTGSVEKVIVGPRALEGRGGLLAPRDSHPRLPPAWCTGLRHRARLPRAARPARTGASEATVSSHARARLRAVVALLARRQPRMKQRERKS